MCSRTSESGQRWGVGEEGEAYRQGSADTGPGGHLEGFWLCLGSTREPWEASEQGRDFTWLSQVRAGVGDPFRRQHLRWGLQVRSRALPTLLCPQVGTLVSGKGAPASLTSLPSFLQAPVGTPKGRLLGGRGGALVPSCGQSGVVGLGRVPTN